MLGNVAVMLVYMLVGIFICKIGKASASHAKSMSGLLIFVLGPMMIINSFLRIEYSAEVLRRIALFFAVTLVIQILFFGILYTIFNKKYKEAKYRILTCASVLGNVGFFGIPVVSGLYPSEPIVACYCSVYVMSMNILVFTVGSYLITNDKKYVSVKSVIFNPTTIALLIAIPLFVLRIKLIGMLDDSVNLLGKMATPMCLIILGMRLSEAKVKNLFTRSFVYVTCLFKLILYPCFAYLCVVWMPFADDVFKGCVLVLSAAPTGAIIESLSELYECEQELSANVVLVTTIISIVTVPVVISLFI